MSTIEKDLAIALRTRPFSETSCIVSWLTERHGRLHTLIKGAHRPKGGWLGQFDLFYTDEILFYFRTPHSLHVLKECTPLATRPAFRTRWPATAAASYLARLMTDLCPLEAPHPELFALLDQALDRLAASPRPDLTLARLEIQILAAAGLAPHLDACVQCHRPISLEESPAFAAAAPDPTRPRAAPLLFSPARGGLLCPACLPLQADSDLGGVRLARDLVRVLRLWQQNPGANDASAPCPEPLLTEALHAVGLFLQYHLDLTVSARREALALLARGRTLARG